MSVHNPIMFIGEVVSGATVSVPLSADANGLLASGLPYTEVFSTASATAPTSTDALIPTMTISPAAGTYLLWFSGDINSGVAGAAISVSVYVGGSQVAQTLRKVVPFCGGTLTSGSARCGVAINCVVSPTSGQAVEIRWSTSSAGPTMAARNLDILRLA